MSPVISSNYEPKSAGLSRIECLYLYHAAFIGAFSKKGEMWSLGGVLKKLIRWTWSVCEVQRFPVILFPVLLLSPQKSAEVRCVVKDRMTL